MGLEFWSGDDRMLQKSLTRCVQQLLPKFDNGKRDRRQRRCLGPVTGDDDRVKLYRKANERRPDSMLGLSAGLYCPGRLRSEIKKFLSYA
ncbi:hypothetical protein NL676_036100 [Syzygium grande]|nr:hypothetical protein NL676_036100 [Syzygium grande]